MVISVFLHFLYSQRQNALYHSIGVKGIILTFFLYFLSSKGLQTIVFIYYFCFIL